MTKPKPKARTAVDAAKEMLAKELEKRPEGIKPIEIVKTVICAYQAREYSLAPKTVFSIESSDRSGLRRGTQASADRLLFNANYWLAAYEDRIVAACDKEDALALLKAITVWGSHTLKLNTLSTEETVAGAAVSRPASIIVAHPYPHL